jgi:hypothetical protein
MVKVKKTTVRRTKRTDPIIWLRQKYEGDVHANPEAYNRAFAGVLRQMADAIAEVKNAWVDPEVVVWMHQRGEITAEVMLSPKE